MGAYVAGARLRADHERAAIAARVEMRWDAARAKSTALDSDGRGLSDIFWRVMCAGEPLPTAERALGWPTRSGRLVLTLALDRLADAYGLPRDLNR